MNRYLSVYIYRCDLGDATNQGVSCPEKSTGKIFLVPCERGNWTEEDINNNPDRFVVLTPVSHPSSYTHLSPPNPDNRWMMMGGNYAYSCDSRFRELSQYPLPIHDRFEG